MTQYQGDPVARASVAADDSLAGWERVPWTTAASTSVTVVDRLTAELDAEWPADRIAEYLTGLGR